MKINKDPYVFVIGNEKGGAGKTTCTMHLITGLLDYGLKVKSIDTDSRQCSLTRYLQNRQKYNELNHNQKVLMSDHYLIKLSNASSIDEQENEERKNFLDAFEDNSNQPDVIVIDTPGHSSFLCRLAHSYANTIITPINDSFLDIDVLAKINPENLSIISPSIYSEMIWQQKLQKAHRDYGTINWIILRNRLSSVDAINKRQVAKVLEELSKRVSFKIAPGFSERVIFRELFLQGLTLLDLLKINSGKSLTMSHIAARQELRGFLKFLNIKELFLKT